MKKLLFIILIFLPFNAFSETYFCSYELSKYKRHGEIETFIFERNGNFFNFHSGGKKQISDFEIIKETDSLIILIDSKLIPLISIVFLNKRTQEFTFDFYSMEEVKTNNHKADYGKCEIYN
jgi:hypothetical protein